MFAIENKEDPAAAPSSAPKVPPLVAENSRENGPDTTPQEAFAVLSTVLDLPIDSFDPNIDTKKMKIKESIKMLGIEKTEEAITAELQNMLKKGVFAPVPKHDRRAIPSEHIIPSMLFIKSKDGKPKARLVAGGHRQDDQLYSRLTSPTIKPQTIFAVAVYGAENFWVAAVMDVGRAYLNASRAGQRQLFMKITSKEGDLWHD